MSKHMLKYHIIIFYVHHFNKWLILMPKNKKIANKL